MEEISLQKEKRNLTFGKNEYPLCLAIMNSIVWRLRDT
jgi:hypothetical protein